MRSLNEKLLERVHLLLSKGGCPANNTKCLYLVKNFCICTLPRLNVINKKITCEDAKFI